MKTEKLSQRLRSLCEAYAEKHGATDFYFHRDNGFAYVSLTRKPLRLEFVYSERGSRSYPPSTLSCRVFLDGSAYYYELQELIDYLDIYDYHCYSFPYIESSARLEACFTYLVDFIDYRFEEFCTLVPQAEAVKAYKLHEIKRVYGYDETLVPKDAAGQETYFSNIFRHYSDFLTGRYTTAPAYLHFVKCEFSAALECYEKSKETTGYEKKLIRFMETQRAPYQAITPECAALLDREEYSKPSLGRFALLIAVCGTVGWLIFFTVQLLINTAYLASTDFVKCANPAITALCGVLPGVIAAVVLRRRLEPYLQRNTREALNFSRLSETSFQSKMPFAALACILLLSVLLFSFLSKPEIAVYKEYITCRNGSSAFSTYEQYKTEDFEKVVIIQGYYTDKNYTEYIESPYCLFIFNGNRTISSKDLHLNEDEITLLLQLLYPQMEDYELREFPSIEDVY